MNNELLSQEEINALLNKAAAEAEDDLTSEEKDIIGEIGNISMSIATTYLLFKQEGPNHHTQGIQGILQANSR